MGDIGVLSKLKEDNEDIIKFLREWDKEQKLEFYPPDIENYGVINALMELYNDNSLLETYLKNARRLEELNVMKIKRLEDFEMWTYYYEDRRHKFKFNFSDDGVKSLEKCYTDGEVVPQFNEKTVANVADEDGRSLHGNYTAPFIIKYDCPFKFVLRTSTDLDYNCKPREISIMDFSFDGSKLPTEEELKSTEVPKSFIKKY